MLTLPLFSPIPRRPPRIHIGTALTESNGTAIRESELREKGVSQSAGSKCYPNCLLLNGCRAEADSCVEGHAGACQSSKSTMGGECIGKKGSTFRIGQSLQGRTSKCYRGSHWPHAGGPNLPKLGGSISGRMTAAAQCSLTLFN
jgi:hypothetical protein